MRRRTFVQFFLGDILYWTFVLTHICCLSREKSATLLLFQLLFTPWLYSLIIFNYLFNLLHCGYRCIRDVTRRNKPILIWWLCTAQRLTSHVGVDDRLQRGVYDCFNRDRRRKIPFLPADPELSVGWVDPRVGLGWIGSGWVEILKDF